MHLICISREFGSGGRELGKRLAELLGWDYYDREIITALAKESGFSETYIEEKLRQPLWQSFPLTYRSTLQPAVYVENGQVDLLVGQRKVLEGIAQRGHDAVIVGRNADLILAEYNPLSIFVCADQAAKLKRCQERAPEGENLSEKELLKNMKQVDKARAQTRAIISDTDWGDREGYHLIVNTTDWDLKALSAAVAEFSKSFFQQKPSSDGGCSNV